MTTFHPELHARDYAILAPLVYCYRATTAEAEARAHNISSTTARKRLDRLADGRLVSRLTAWASAIPTITAPLKAWSPGDPTPDFGAIAHLAQSRWRDRPIRPATIYVASRKLLAMYALPPRPPLKLHQATHDLGLREVYVYCRSRWPQCEFVGEDMFAHERGHGEGVEDAQLREGQQIIAVIEFAGAYRKDRVEHFHSHVAQRQLPYFLF